MHDITPPEVLRQNSVTIIRPGENYASLYEKMLENLTCIQQLSQFATPPYIVVDLQHVKFIGSAFLGLMVTTYKTTTARESGRFALCGLNTFCQTAISILKLENVIEIFDTADDAVRAFTADFRR